MGFAKELDAAKEDVPIRAMIAPPEKPSIAEEEGEESVVDDGRTELELEVATTEEDGESMVDVVVEETWLEDNKVEDETRVDVGRTELELEVATTKGDDDDCPTLEELEITTTDDDDEETRLDVVEDESRLELGKTELELSIVDERLDERLEKTTTVDDTELLLDDFEEELRTPELVDRTTEEDPDDTLEIDTVLVDSILTLDELCRLNCLAIVGGQVPATASIESGPPLGLYFVTLWKIDT
ncbi:hypothetical protein BDZ45DRAFT_741437 [Acephala macrosclerotiorum]|nr:hypothetical protein BDZ45DRAFT_741437 [Acephala macrosclerotiorum]